MNNYLLVNSPGENSKKAEKYILRYLKELKLHFNLSDKQLVALLGSTLNNIKRESQNQKTWFSFFKRY